MAILVPKSVEISSLIAKPPHLHEGRPVIAGTALLVRTIIMDHKQNMSAEEIAYERSLTLAQVHAALAYFYANQKEIENDITAYHDEYQRLEQEWKQKHAKRNA